MPLLNYTKGYILRILFIAQLFLHILIDEILLNLLETTSSLLTDPKARYTYFIYCPASIYFNY